MLDYKDRFLRRTFLTMETGARGLDDTEKATSLDPGGAFVMSHGAATLVTVARQTVLVIAAPI